MDIPSATRYSVILACEALQAQANHLDISAPNAPLLDNIGHLSEEDCEHLLKNWVPRVKILVTLMEELDDVLPEEYVREEFRAVTNLLFLYFMPRTMILEAASRFL